METALIRYQGADQYTAVEVIDPDDAPLVAPTSNMGAQAFAFAEAIARMVVAEQRRPQFGEPELDFLWGVAYQEWLETGTKTGDPRPRATYTAYSAAWQDLLTFCPAHPRRRCTCPLPKMRDIDELRIKAWVEDLRTRDIDPTVEAGLIRNGRRQPGQVGLSPATVNQWLAGISSFYSYCQNYPVKTADNRTVPLFDGLNPAKSQIIKRPKAKRLGQEVMWLDKDQLANVLRAVRCAQTLADLQTGVATSQRTIKELRDYALLHSYALTVARNREVREWQWKHLTRKGSKIYYQWDNKAKDGTDELPADCWQAVQDYLRLAGRLNNMQPDDYIFQPVGDSILRMTRPDGTPVVDPATWSRNRAISGQEANRLLRAYCRKGGIAESDIPKLHIHSLRHSGVMLYLAGGVPVERVSKRAHHSSLDMTMRYTHELQGQANPDWQTAANLLGL